MFTWRATSTVFQLEDCATAIKIWFLKRLSIYFQNPMRCLDLSLSLWTRIWDRILGGFFLIPLTSFYYPHPLINRPLISLGGGSLISIWGSNLWSSAIQPLWAKPTTLEIWNHEPFSCLEHLVEFICRARNQVERDHNTNTWLYHFSEFS